MVQNNLFRVIPQQEYVMYSVRTTKRPFFYYWFRNLPKFVGVLASTAYNLGMKRLKDYEDPTVEDLMQFITNTSFSLHFKKSDRKEYEYYIDMDRFNKKKLNIPIDRSMSKVYLNTKTNQCGIELVDKRFIPDISDPNTNFIAYTLSHLNLFLAFDVHGWIHFHLPDLFYTNVDMYLCKSCLLYEFIYPFIMAVPVANNQGLTFGRFPNARFMIMDSDVFLNEEIESTMKHYSTCSSDKLFHLDDGIESNFVILHQQLYDQTIELVRGVYAYLEESDKYNMMLILTNVKANVEGMKNDEINEENCIRLIARVIHQISYIHSIDHFYLHYTLRDKKINMFYGNIYKMRIRVLSIYLTHSFMTSVLAQIST
jgi:hypothetical protein